MSDKQKEFKRIPFLFFAFIAGLFSLITNNLIPYFSLPTLGQAFWAVGFAQSIANSSVFTAHASNFGFPYGGNISFGLSAVYPMSILLRLGFSPANSYIIIFTLFILISFVSAYKISRHFKVNQYTSVLLSLLWVITPVVVQHANYSMLTLGIALLPFYFFSFMKAMTFCDGNQRLKFYTFSLFICTVSSVISIFMDGYIFIMQAVLNSFYLMYFLSKDNNRTLKVIVKVVSVHAFACIFSYILYAAFIGRSGYEPQQLSFFRSWGVDISFLAAPSSGISWLLDNLHWSVFRTEAQYYGDSSVWRTTFLLPMLILSLCHFSKSKIRNNKSIVILFLSVFIFSLYFSLGPSFKFMLLKPTGQPDLSPIIPDNYPLLPTGTGWISEHIPGFDVMRASYRWIALSFFAIWCLVVLLLSSCKNNFFSALLVSFAILFYIPPLENHLSAGRYYNEAFERVDNEVVRNLKPLINSGDLVAYVPWGNDFLANYLSSALNVKSFNLGGDKNVQQSMVYWPQDFLNLRGELKGSSLKYIIRLLSFENVNVVIIPNFDMLWSAHVWPCKMPDTPVEAKMIYPDFTCPGAKRMQFLPLVNILKQEKYLDVTEKKLFTVIRLNKNAVNYPLLFSTDTLVKYRVLGNGWYDPEEKGIWSSARAVLKLPVVKEKFKGATLRLNFHVFNTSVSHPRKVIFRVKLSNKSYEKTIISVGGNDHVDLNVDNIEDAFVTFEVVDAVSPSVFGSHDERVLGLFLTSINNLSL